ncbi:MAG: TetR/AcrR family transcriptional regulator [Alphaproteobacteria bacterium]
MDTLENTDKDRKPGRPRSTESQQAIFEATSRLMDSMPVRALTIEGVAKAAGVGKPTIYRWWDSKCALVMDVFLAKTAAQVPIAETGSVVAALSDHVQRVITMLRGRPGQIVAEIVGEGQADPHILEEFRERFFLRLLAPARAAIERGKQTGELPGDLDTDLAMDLIYGPIYYRLLVGHQPLDKAFARSLAKRVAAAVQAR